MNDPCEPAGFKVPIVNMSYRERLRWAELRQGVVRLNSAIVEDTASQFLSELEYFRRKQVPRVMVKICSPGGGAYYALAIYDALRDISASGTKVIALVEGFAASAAAMIVLQAADERICRANARFLLHETRRWVFFAVERTSDLEDEVKEMQALTERIVEIIATRAGKTRDEVQRLIERKEVWMSATEAKEWKLVDRIV